MATPLLNAYAENLPRLTAEESLQAAERTAVGTGSLKKGVGRRITHDWERQTDQKQVVLRPKGAKEYRAAMASMGIGVKLEKTVPDG